MIGTLASRALTSADTISREPLGVIASAWMPVWIRFSTICICFSTSISRSAACTCKVTPSRSAASCAPRRMSTKKGWLSVLSTSATVGLLVVVEAVSRLQERENRAISTMPPRRHDDAKTLCMMFSLQNRIEQDRNDDDAADHDLLKER